MKFFDKKILPILGLTLLVGCTDPNAEIKELNSNELSDVIDALYIEDKKSDFDNINLAQVESQENPKPSNVLQNSNIVNTPTNAKTAPNTADKLDGSNSEPIQSEPISEKPSIDEKNIEINNNAEKISSSGFSEPTTVSETISEKILKELLAKYPTIDYSNSELNAVQIQAIYVYCLAISERLSSVSNKNCLDSNHHLSPFNTVDGNPIVVTEFAPKEGRKPLGKILVIGGTHGDELTSVSTVYKWISNLNKFHSGLFHWHIAPALNVDGILKRPATRPNANGVDINRNLPTPDWNKQSVLRWEKLSKNLRKNPGSSAASEPETQWIMHEIATFKPDAIVSIHAPYGILDFDAPKLNNAPKNFGRLQLNLLGTYPGSLGNYAGIQRKIPVLTLELHNATTMPSQKELNAIWSDMIKWLRVQLSSQ